MMYNNTFIRGKGLLESYSHIEFFKKYNFIYYGELIEIIDWLYINIRISFVVYIRPI